jgi:hypothetical protein
MNYLIYAEVLCRVIIILQLSLISILLWGYVIEKENDNRLDTVFEYIEDLKHE